MLTARSSNHRYFGTSSALNEGGSCTFGATDASLYSGDINYIDMPSVRSLILLFSTRLTADIVASFLSTQGSRTYWLIPFDLAIVDDVLVTLAANTNAAIDTGTTLIVSHILSYSPTRNELILFRLFLLFRSVLRKTLRLSTLRSTEPKTLEEATGCSVRSSLSSQLVRRLART